MIRRPPRSTQSRSSAASDVYKRQIAGAVVIFLYGSGWGLLAFAGMLMVVLILARMPLWPLLKSLRTVWVIILITALLQFFLTPGKVVFSRGFLTVTDTGLYNGLIFSSRVVILVLLLAALVMTTPPLALADALSSLFSPLRRLKIPVGHVTTVMSITLMFIPNILEVGRKVMRAQMARGADFESVSYTHLRAHETRHDLVCRLLLEKKKKQKRKIYK